MTDADLAAIEARCEKATEGPWESDFQHAVCVYGPRGEDGERAFIGALEEETDRAFVEHARTDIPALLAEVRRLRTENEQIQKWAQTTLDYADERIAVLREGIEHAARLTGHGRMVAILNNLLAGREWSYAEVDNG